MNDTNNTQQQGQINPQLKAFIEKQTVALAITDKNYFNLYAIICTHQQLMRQVEAITKKFAEESFPIKFNGKIETYVESQKKRLNRLLAPTVKLLEEIGPTSTEAEQDLNELMLKCQKEVIAKVFPQNKPMVS